MHFRVFIEFLKCSIIYVHFQVVIMLWCLTVSKYIEKYYVQVISVFQKWFQNYPMRMKIYDLHVGCVGLMILKLATQLLIYFQLLQ